MNFLCSMGYSGFTIGVDRTRIFRDRHAVHSKIAVTGFAPELPPGRAFVGVRSIAKRPSSKSVTSVCVPLSPFLNRIQKADMLISFRGRA